MRQEVAGLGVAATASLAVAVAVGSWQLAAGSGGDQTGETPGMGAEFDYEILVDQGNRLIDDR